MLWIAQWGLSRDPFADTSGTYVPLPGHEEAVARLLHTIESGGRLAVLSAPPGLGKTRVLGQALELARSPMRRIALAKCPTEWRRPRGSTCREAGVRVPASSGRGHAWGALERGIRLCTVQGLAVVLAVDGCRAVNSAETSETLAPPRPSWGTGPEPGDGSSGRLRRGHRTTTWICGRGLWRSD